MSKITIKELKECKGNKEITAINTYDINIAKACALVGVDNIVFGKKQPVEMIIPLHREVRCAVPNTLITGVLPMVSEKMSDELRLEMRFC